MSVPTLYRAFANTRHISMVGKNPSICFEEWRVVKKTPKGWWIERLGEKRWTSGKFASMTKEEAVNRLRLRKRSHVKHEFVRLMRAIKEAETVGAPLYRDQQLVADFLKTAPLDYYHSFG